MEHSVRRLAALIFALLVGVVGCSNGPEKQFPIVDAGKSPVSDATSGGSAGASIGGNESGGNAGTPSGGESSGGNIGIGGAPCTGTLVAPEECPVCGDGVVDVGEQCDDGANGNDRDGCSDTCARLPLPFCGDGVVDDGEQCDDGDIVNANGCTNACTLPTCGDGIVQTIVGEECDDANLDDFDACTNDCISQECGNGVVEGNEECDDGNTVNMDGCRNDCTETFCGDGALQLGEQCDDGNTVNGDGCSASCVAPPPPNKSFECAGDWVADEGLADEGLDLDVAYAPVALSENNVYVIGGTYSDVGVVHHDGATWSREAISDCRINALAKVGATVWAGGGGSSGACIRQRTAEGWVSVPLPSHVLPGTVRSIWGATSNRVFVEIPQSIGIGTEITTILLWKNGTWEEMIIPPHTGEGYSTRIAKLWGKSFNEVYAIGSVWTGNPYKPLLWRFDGEVWSDISGLLPNDVLELKNIDGSGPQVVFSGYAKSTGGSIHISTRDFVSWEVDSLSQEGFFGSVWVPWDGAVLLGGGMNSTDPFTPSTLAIQSRGVWTSLNTQVPSSFGGIGSLTPVPNSNQVILTGGGSATVSGPVVFRGTCSR